MRFAPEADHGANAGLNVARDKLQTVKDKFPQITYSDLWVRFHFCFKFFRSRWVGASTHWWFSADRLLLELLLFKKWVDPTFLGELAEWMGMSPLVLPMGMGISFYFSLLQD